MIMWGEMFFPLLAQNMFCKVQVGRATVLYENLLALYVGMHSVQHCCLIVFPPPPPPPQGLKAENDLTVQTKALLEQKIEALTSRSETLDDLQEQFAAIKAQHEALQQEKEMDSEKIEELLARNAHLELEFKH